MNNFRPELKTLSLQSLDFVEVKAEIHVLIVEDSESDRVSYNRYLQSDSERKYHITEAETLEAGLELWRSHQPDIVLLDVNLPDGDGLEFLEAISTDHVLNKLPVIMLTGSGDERIAVRAMKLGASDYLVKGDLTAVALLTCIKQVQENNLLVQQLRRAQQQQTIIASMSLHIRRSLTFEAVCNVIVQEVCSFLVADRTIIYRFNPEMSGKIVSEAVVSPWGSCLDEQIEDTCFRENLGGEYQNGKVFAAHDIYEANLTECHIQLLERFQIRANLVVPILLNGTNFLWGLLIVQQCSAPRQWHEEDIQLLHQLSVHLAIALQQAELYQNLESLNSSLEQKVQERTQEIQLQAQMLDQIHDAVISSELDGTIITWNSGAERLYEYQSHEAIGQNVSMLYLHEDLLLKETEVFTPLMGKETHEVELRNRTKSGNIIYISLRLSVVRDALGNPIRLIGCSNNISDRKRAEQELQQLNQELEAKVKKRTTELQNLSERLALALKSGAVGCWEWDLVKNTKFWDERMYELYGMPKQADGSINYEDWANSIHPEDRSSIEILLQQAISGEAEYNTEFRIFHPDGTLHFIKAYGVLVRDEQDHSKAMIGINFDISDRKRMETALIESESKFRRLVEGANNLIWSTDANGLFDYLSPQFQTIFGFDPNEWLSKPSLDLVHTDHLDLLVGKYVQNIQSGQNVSNAEFRHLHQDGHYVWVSVNVTPIISSEGIYIGAQGILTDISDRKQAEIQLKHINDELLNATKLKDEFLANMSHELRTPLNSILGLSNAMGEEVLGSLNKRQLKAIGTVESSGEHLLSLINDILDLSKISSGMMELNAESVSVKNLCDSSLVFIKQQAFQKQVQIASNIPKNINKINVEERRIRQVLINLLTNAVKFTPSNGKVSLLVAVGGGDTWQGEAKIPQRIKLMNSPMIVFQVVDTGIGIAPNDLQRLFQPFVQVSSSLNRQYEGTGLGLALVKQIVELHGGQVMAESELGKGSCFSVALPYEPSQSSAPESITVSTTLPPVVIDPDHAPLILLAEDNEANIETFTSYLTAINYRIVVAKNGVEAVAMAKSESPDMIIMDIQMPDMDGLEAIGLIRADESIAAIPIIALTALAMEGDRERCLAAGANEYLSKPIKFRQLNSAIQQILPKLL